MSFLSDNILYFLIDKDWTLTKETEYYYYLAPPKKIKASKGYKFKLIKENNSIEYKNLIDTAIDNLFEIYGDLCKKTLNKFRNDNLHSERKHLGKADWIIPEEKSRGEKIDLYDIYIPESEDL